MKQKEILMKDRETLQGEMNTEEDVKEAEEEEEAEDEDEDEDEDEGGGYLRRRNLASLL